MRRLRRYYLPELKPPPPPQYLPKWMWSSRTCLGKRQCNRALIQLVAWHGFYGWSDVRTHTRPKGGKPRDRAYDNIITSFHRLDGESTWRKTKWWIVFVQIIYKHCAGQTLYHKYTIYTTHLHLYLCIHSIMPATNPVFSSCTTVVMISHSKGKEMNNRSFLSRILTIVWTTPYTRWWLWMLITIYVFRKIHQKKTSKRP